jgi:glycosyltransferase involved in cell wall biosynthesis
MKSVSVIIPCLNEEKYIAGCIDSLLSQSYPSNLIEIIVVDGMSSDNTRAIVSAYCSKYPQIKMIENPAKFVSQGLNLGIQISTGEVIFRIDTHCTYPNNYIQVLEQQLSVLNAENVGAVLVTMPADSRKLSHAIAVGMSHRFGVGNSLFRIGINHITETDTVAFGCFRRTIFERIGYFDTALIRNQDDEFNARIRKNGGKIYIIPDITVHYYARSSLKNTALMFYQYGLFKPLVNKKLGSAATLRQFIPPLFVLGIITGLVLTLILPYFYSILYLSILFLYVALAFLFSLIESRRKKDPWLICLLPVVFLVLHTSYGAGYLIGILKFYLAGETSTEVLSSR